MRLSCRNVLCVKPGATLVLYLLLGVLEEHTILRLCTWGVAISLSHVWFLQVSIMLFNPRKESFYPRWYFVVPAAMHMCIYSGFVFVVVHDLAWYRWNSIVQFCYAAVVLHWGLTFSIFARLGYLYCTKNMNHVQLEIDWMIITVLHWVYCVVGSAVEVPWLDKIFVWKQIARHQMKADFDTHCREVLEINTMFNTIPTRPLRLRVARGASPRRLGAPIPKT